MSRSVSHLQAIGFALASYTFWVFTDIGIKLAPEAGGMSPYELMGFMGLSAATAMFVMTVIRKETKKLRMRDWRPQVLCAACSIICTVANTIALKHLSLTIFYVVVFTAPMVIAILAAIFLKEKLTLIKSLGVITGFIGVLIAIYKPHMLSSQNDWIGYIAGSVAVASYGVQTIRMRGMTQSESLESIAFFSAVALAVTGFIWTLIDFHHFVTAGIGIALLSGLFNLGGNLFSYKALRHTTASNVLQIQYTQIISGAIFAYFIWGDVPTVNIVIGATIIITSGLAIAAHARKTKPLPTIHI